MEIRNASLDLGVSGLKPESWTYQDSASGKSDTLEFSLRASDSLAGQFQTGQQFSPRIVARSWKTSGDQLVQPLGKLEIDEIELDVSRRQMLIRAISTPPSSSLRRTKKTRAFENSSMQKIIMLLAAENGLAGWCQFSDVSFTRLEQRQQSDLDFISQICARYGLSVKVADWRLLVFDQESYDFQSSVETLTLGSDWITGGRLIVQTHDTYSSCTVAYWDAQTEELRKYTHAQADISGTGQELKLNRRVESLSAARQMASGSLKQANKWKVTGTLELVGNPLLCAAQKITLKNFGSFDGTFIIESARHSQGRSGYRTSVTIRKYLEGWDG